MGSMLMTFIENDMNVLLSLLAGAAIAGRSLKKRDRWSVGLVQGIALFLLVGMLFNRLRAGSEAGTQAAQYYSIFKYICFFAVSCLGAWRVFQCHPLTALYCVTQAYCLEHMSQRGYSILIILIPQLGTLTGGFWLYERLELLVVSLAVYFAAYQQLFKKHVLDSEELKSKVLLVLIAAAVILADIVLSLSLIGIAAQTGSQELDLYTNFFSILASLLALILSFSQLEVQKAKQEAEILKRLMAQEREHYQKDKATVDAINIKCHDLKHQLSMVKSRLDRDQYEELKGLVDIYDTAFQTGNPALDVVLSGKGLLCQQKEISFSCLADGSRLSFLKDSDIYSLFSNLLDNAIEAEEKLKDPRKKYITMSVTGRDGFVMIHQDNYFEGTICFDSGLPVTTKEDRQYHGFGTKSILSITEEYGGDLKINAQDGVYQLDILLPVPMA